MAKRFSKYFGEKKKNKKRFVLPAGPGDCAVERLGGIGKKVSGQK